MNYRNIVRMIKNTLTEIHYFNEVTEGEDNQILVESESHGEVIVQVSTKDNSVKIIKDSEELITSFNPIVIIDFLTYSD